MSSDFLSIIRPSSFSAAPEREGASPSKKQSYPVLPLRDTVLFPHSVLPLTVGRDSSIQLVQSLGEERTVVVVANRHTPRQTPPPPGFLG